MTILLLCVAIILTPSTGSVAQMAMKGTGKQGRMLFYSSAISTNGLACNNCHADFDEDKYSDGLRRPGHSLFNAAGRKTWWGQEKNDIDLYPDVAHAAIVCVEHFMRNSNKLTAQQMLNLQAYLQGITRQSTSNPLAITPSADKTGLYAGFDGGDKIRGRNLFHSACHACHPNGNSGIGPALPRNQAASFYAQKIREGDGLGKVLSGVDPNAYDPQSGMYMPFFGADRLSNHEVRDIISFIKTLSGP